MKRSKFSLSHYKLMSLDMGELAPCGLVEVLAGDSVQQATSVLVRVSPLLAPVMHPVSVRVHHWFIPHRLVWEDWEDFITGGPDGMDASTFPTITITYTAGSPDTGSGIVGELADYLGVPTKINGLEVSALPFRCYAAVFNEFYRDQDLVTELALDVASGADSTTNTLLQNVAWERDYFTAARPWTQKGPEVSIPLTGDAVVRGLAISSSPAWNILSGTQHESGANDVTAADTDGNRYTTEAYLRQDAANLTYPNVYADLSGVSGVNLADLRLASALQVYEEARARYGSRYTEYLRYLGVRSSDGRLQRPEYLGGGRQTIQFSEVLQTAEGTDAVGTLRGHGIAAVRSNRYRRFFEEHGYILSLLSVRPKTIYGQSLDKTWNRRTKEDFWQRELQHIGQEEVQNKEVYAAHATPDGVFGYSDRYESYRRQVSGIAGEFRTTDLDFYHMARLFASDPALNSTFVTATPTKRVNAVQTNDVLWVMCNHSIQARRLVSGSAKSFLF